MAITSIIYYNCEDMLMKVPESYYNLINEYMKRQCEEDECVNLVSAAKLPSRFGEFTALGFQQTYDEKEHAAFAKGDVVGKEDVLVRIHSECLTGDAIGSLRCDCRDQLEGALININSEEEGIVIYLRQEGRGIGLTNKLRAYKLQDEGLNTVEANLALGFPDDMREYSIASHILKSLKVKSVRLMTNNPNKLRQLEKYGINITSRVPHIYDTNQFNEFYLQTKKELSQHML
ncbi:MAG: GTP cyclohydrolase II [Candidatus Heimdallarchaeota archaeon]|nr:GTP cyclohydrolase II [Candidatus Heimdallarchaeota archaeon]